MVESWDIQHFAPSELLTMGTRHGQAGHPAHGFNTLPPEDLWENIRTILLVASIARETHGPLLIASAYRSPAYNRAVGGVENSQHVQFRALDLVPLETSPHLLARRLHEMRRNRVFRGGIGTYRTFIHIDSRGKNNTWGDPLLDIPSH